MHTLQGKERGKGRRKVGKERPWRARRRPEREGSDDSGGQRRRQLGRGGEAIGEDKGRREGRRIRRRRGKEEEERER